MFFIVCFVPLTLVLRSVFELLIFSIYFNYACFLNFISW
jgi:hypothetical protein